MVANSTPPTVLCESDTTDSMTEPQDNSSLPILLVIAGVVLLIVGGGWFLLDQDTAAPPEQSESSVAETEIPFAPDLPVAAPEPVVQTPVTDIDAELRKARLAAEADILAYPQDQSALYFYSRILTADPGHEVARAELDAVLSRISRTVTGHLAANEYEEAYDLASQVARTQPGHSLVIEVQQTLDALSGDLVEQAIQFAQDGNDAESTAALAAAEAVPGRSSQYFAAVRDSIGEIQDSLQTAEATRLENERQAAAQSQAEWVDKVRGAINSGSLIEPAGGSARDFLSEQPASNEQHAELRGELAGALITAITTNIDQDQLPVAEEQIDAAYALGGDEAEIDDLKVALEQAYIDAEASKVLRLEDFDRINTAPARYPRRASDRGISGWVEVTFTVTESGNTADIVVVNTDPNDIFNESAIRAVEQWTFEPREFRGRLIAQRAAARLVFRLE